MSNEMSPQERQVLIAEFLSESSGFLQELNQKLVSAEEHINRGEEFSDDDLHEMFRAAHNIKGMAAFVGLVVTQNLTHEMETVLSLVRNRDVVLDSHVIDVLFGVFDMLETQFISLKETSREVTDVSGIMAQLKEIQNAARLPGISREQLASLSSGKTAVPPSAPPAAEPEKPAAVLSEPAPADPEEPVKPAPRENEEHEEPQGEEEPRGNLEKYLSKFIDDTDHQIVNFNNILLAVESKTGTAQSVHELFRITHTIKGSAGLVGAKKIARVAHSMENLLSHYRTTKTDMGETTISLLFGGIDVIKDIITQFREKSGKKIDVGPICAMLNSVYFELTSQDAPELDAPANPAGAAKPAPRPAANTQPAPAPEPAAAKPAVAQADLTADQLAAIAEDVFRLEVAISQQAPLKSVKMLLALAKLAECGKVLRVTPAPEQISDAAKEAVQAEILFASSINERDIRASLGIDLFEVISVERLEKSQPSAKPAETEREGKKDTMETIMETGDAGQDGKQGAVKTNGIELSTIRIDSNKLDTLMNLAGELVIVRARFSQLLTMFNREILVQRDSAQTAGHIKSSAELLSKEVRVIAKSLSKDVLLKIEGETTELDKKIVDSLGDPLTHMVRNAVDHGIEDIETRKKLGKPPMGTICLSAMHKGNSIWIEVRDDGRGIDTEKVTDIAVKKGLFSEQQIEKMTEKDKLNILFMPGFSTAEKVTNLSGRGVGMDVVKNMISSVNGTIDVETEVGKGTTFILKIPLTLAIIEALLVIIGNAPYAFPLEAVTEIVKVSVDDIYSVNGNDTIKLRDHALSLVELPEVLRVRAGKQGEITHKRIVVITDGNKKVGVAVDELVGEEEIVIKSLPEQFSHVRGITGASILGDGRIALILDPADIISKANKA